MWRVIWSSGFAGLLNTRSGRSLTLLEVLPRVGPSRVYHRAPWKIDAA